MRKILSLAVCFVLFSTVAAYAQSDIVVFDRIKVSQESDVMKEAQAALDKNFGSQKEALEKERVALEKLSEEYEKKQPTEKQRAELEEKARVYTEKAQAFLRLLQNADNRVRNDIDTVIETAAKELAVRKGYKLVIDSAATPFFDPSFDVTNDMLTEVNTVWKNSKKQ